MNPIVLLLAFAPTFPGLEAPARRYATCPEGRVLQDVPSAGRRARASARERSALAAQHPTPGIPLTRGTLSFDGHATLGSFVGTTDSVRGAMTGGPDLTAVTGWVEASVASLRTGNGKRDKDLRKSMEVEQHPTMRFDLDRVEPGRAEGDTVAVVLHGALTIHGVHKAVTLPGRVWRAGNDWRLRSDFPLNVKDYGVGGLKKMLVLKMNEHITVHVDVTFGR